MSAALKIVEYTDPSCPFAFSAEPFKRKLTWTYGGNVEWTVKVVGLSSSGEEVAAKGFTPDKLSAAQARLAELHGMPIDSTEQPRMAASMPACRAVVATRLNAVTRIGYILRALRVRAFSGQLLDEQETIDGAARDAGIDPAQLAEWMGSAAVEEALAQDLHDARHPTAATLLQDHKLADWEGGRRYTCPSYEMNNGIFRISAPGFQPWAVYDVATANLAPDLPRRPAPASAREVLAWAPFPLATREIAVLRDQSDEEAREELEKIAEFSPVGNDGYWTLAS